MGSEMCIRDRGYQALFPHRRVWYRRMQNVNSDGRYFSGAIARHSKAHIIERSEFLIDTSQKKSLRVCTCARVHACSTNLGFNVWYYVQHTWYVRTWYQLVISPLPRYVYVSTYVPGWGTYNVPHMFENCCVTTFVCTW